MNKLTLLIIPAFFCIHTVFGQKEPSASTVLENSINYHDPNGKLASKEWKMVYEDESHFSYNPKNGDYEVKRLIKGNEVVLKEDKKGFRALVNGSSSFNEKVVDPKYTSEQRGTLMRDYYHYLWFLPMKLKDDGTILHEEVSLTDFFGKESLQLKVTYAPEVGEDIWYIYFHPSSFALQGYRFYHDESANDGEYIILDGEVESKGVRIPQTRRWYTHKEDKFLGEDKLVKLTFE